jgi:hypothetical protein
VKDEKATELYFKGKAFKAVKEYVAFEEIKEAPALVEIKTEAEEETTSEALGDINKLREDYELLSGEKANVVWNRKKLAVEIQKLAVGLE